MSPGTLYGSIKRMLADGLIEELTTGAAGADERRRFYRLTKFGRRVAAGGDRTPGLAALPGPQRGAGAAEGLNVARQSWSERIYRLLLRCYPGEFRDEYEREMLHAFRERLADDRRVGPRAVARLWWQLAGDAIVRAPGEHLDVLRQDVRYALRSLRRAPVFALTAIATLALGVGANTALFSVVHAVALRPLPYEAADRLVRIWEKNDPLAVSGFSVSLPNYVSWKERARTLDLAAWRGGSVTLRGGSPSGPGAVRGRRPGSGSVGGGGGRVLRDPAGPTSPRPGVRPRRHRPLLFARRGDLGCALAPPLRRAARGRRQHGDDCR